MGVQADAESARVEIKTADWTRAIGGEKEADLKKRREPKGEDAMRKKDFSIVANL